MNWKQVLSTIILIFGMTIGFYMILTPDSYYGPNISFGVKNYKYFIIDDPENVSGYAGSDEYFSLFNELSGEDVNGLRISEEEKEWPTDPSYKSEDTLMGPGKWEVLTKSAGHQVNVELSGTTQTVVHIYLATAEQGLYSILVAVTGVLLWFYFYLKFTEVET